MTTAVSTNLSAESRAWSIGPVKVQMVQVAVVSGDTGATVTADGMVTMIACFVTGGPVTLTAQPTFSGNVATLAFSDPVASRFVQCLCIGK